MTALGWSGCRSSPKPEVLFSEAETLRLRYEKAASHQAIAKYREAIGVWERQGQKQPAAQAWQRVGLAYEQLGSLDESLRSHKAALALVEGSSESLLESEIRSDLGVAQANAASRTSELEEARGQCERALALAKLAGGTAETGKALDCRGEVAYFLQDHARALEFYRDAGTVFTTLGHDVGKAQTQLHQGHVYSDLGRFDEAGACLDRAAALWAGIGDRRQQAIVRVAKARLEVRRGNYQKALNQFQEALASLEPMGDAVWEGSSLTGIAWVYEEMAETGPALKHRERALKLFETAGLKIFAVEVLSNLGATYLASGDRHARVAPFRTSARRSPTNWVSSDGRSGPCDSSAWCTSFDDSQPKLSSTSIEPSKHSRASMTRGSTASCGRILVKRTICWRTPTSHVSTSTRP